MLFWFRSTALSTDLPIGVPLFSKLLSNKWSFSSTCIAPVLSFDPFPQHPIVGILHRVWEDRSKYIMNTPFLAHSVQFHHITMLIQLFLIWIPIMGLIHYHLLLWIKFIIISTWRWRYNLLQLAVLTISVKTKSVHFFLSVVISIAYSKHFLITTCPIYTTSLLKTSAKIGAQHSWE